MSYTTKQYNWIVRDGTDTLEHYQHICQKNTIAEVKKWVRRKRNGDVNFDLLLEAEKETKDRKGIKRWVNAILEDRISYEYDLLSWYDRLGILKSAVQKYIRRSETEKALRTAKRLFLMSDRSAVRRMKSIIAEDVLPATPVVQYLNEHTNLREFMGVTGVTAHTKKSGRVIEYRSHLEVLADLEGRKRREKLKEIIEETTGVKQTIAEVYKAVQFGETKELVFEVIERNSVTESLIERALKGTYFHGDLGNLISTAVLYNTRPELFDEIDEKPEVNPRSISIMKFREVDWFALDMHTKIGRTALNIFASQHDIERDDMSSAWFQCSGNHYEDPVREDANEVDEELRFLWNSWGHEIKDLVQYARTEIYNLASYDEF